MLVIWEQEIGTGKFCLQSGTWFLLKERSFAKLLHDRININNNTLPISESYNKGLYLESVVAEKKMNSTETFAVSVADMLLGF